MPNEFDKLLVLLHQGKANKDSEVLYKGLPPNFTVRQFNLLIAAVTTTYAELLVDEVFSIDLDELMNPSS